MRVREQIEAFIASSVLEPGASSSDPLAEGLVDSLGYEQLIAFLEEAFAIVVEDDELSVEHFGSLDAVTRFVSHKRGSAEEGGRR